MIRACVAVLIVVTVLAAIREATPCDRPFWVGFNAAFGKRCN